jgi:hypothetical protein
MPCGDAWTSVTSQCITKKTSHVAISTTRIERNKNNFKVGQPVVCQLNSYVTTVVLHGATCCKLIDRSPTG